MPAKARKTWKGWGVFGPKGAWRKAYRYKFQATHYSDNWDDIIVPVLITLAPKGKAKK